MRAHLLQPFHERIEDVLDELEREVRGRAREHVLDASERFEVALAHTILSLVRPAGGDIACCKIARSAQIERGPLVITKAGKDVDALLDGALIIAHRAVALGRRAPAIRRAPERAACP